LNARTAQAKFIQANNGLTLATDCSTSFEEIAEKHRHRWEKDRKKRIGTDIARQSFAGH
jgi:hypothetical protein